MVTAGAWWALAPLVHCPLPSPCLPLCSLGWRPPYGAPGCLGADLSQPLPLFRRDLGPKPSRNGPKTGCRRSREQRYRSCRHAKSRQAISSSRNGFPSGCRNAARLAACGHPVHFPYTSYWPPAGLLAAHYWSGGGTLSTYLFAYRIGDIPESWKSRSPGLSLIEAEALHIAGCRGPPKFVTVPQDRSCRNARIQDDPYLTGGLAARVATT